MATLGNTYPNLPGMLVQFKDGGQALRFDDNEILTDSMLLLGTATDGPVMEPVAVDINTIELLFGNETEKNGTPNGSTLVHAFKQAYAAGCTDIRLMRVTGDKATSKIQTASKAETIQDRVDEDLSIVFGNDETIINLSNTPITNTLKILVKGVELKEGYSQTGSRVTIKANACEAGVSILAKYKYIGKVDKLESLAINENKTIQLLDTTTKEGLSITNSKGVKIPLDGVTILNNIITLPESLFTSTLEKKTKAAPVLEIGEIVKVEYKVNAELDGNDSKEGDVPFITETSLQRLILSREPNLNSLVLYIDDARVLDDTAYTVEGEILSIKKERFLKDQRISVSYYVDKTQTIENSIKLESIFAGGVYNTGTIQVKNISDNANNVIGKSIIITKPEAKIGTAELPQEYTSFNFVTFGDLVDAINANNSVYEAFTDTPEALVKDLLPSNAYFENGDDGLKITKDELFEKLSGKRDKTGALLKEGAYQLLENYQVDYIVPLGVYADDKLQDRHQNFAYELALVCAAISQMNKTTYGMIATKPIRNTSLAKIQEHAEYLANLNNNYFMRDISGAIITSKDGEPFDLGKFISVVAGPSPLFSHRINALREANPAVMYCAFNTTLQPQSAATNKMLRGSKGIKYVFSNAQLNNIVGNRLVTFGTKYTRSGQAIEGCYIVDAPTAARIDSEYTRLTTCNVVRTTVDNVREVSDPFLGEANTIEQRNALTAEISKRLDLLVEKGVLIEYNLNIKADAKDMALGHAKVELGLYAPQELKKITTVVGLKR